MESIGEKLRQKREELSYSIDQVARDTNIAKAYLIALENEKFEEFPGETYLVGFLRNYSEYLGLNAEEVISLYKSFKIQEQPIPMDELLDTPRVPWLLIGVIVAVIGGLVVGSIFIFPDIFFQNSAAVSESVQEEADAQAEPAETEIPESSGPVLDMEEDILEQRFDEGSVIRFSKSDVNYQIILKKIDSNITMVSGDKEFILELGQEEMLDLDESGDPDIYVLIRDIDGNAGVIRFDRQVVPIASEQTAEETSAAAESASAEDSPVETAAETDTGETQVAASTSTSSTQTTTSDVGSAQVTSRERQAVVILKEQKAEPYTLMIHFRGYCLLRYEVDKQQRIERYFKKDDVLRLDVMEEVRIWLSNGGNASAKISGNPVVFGRPGEVSSGLIRWERREGAYELTLKPIY